MFEPLKDNSTVNAIRQLSDACSDRLDFHKRSEEFLRKMGSLEFASLVFETNLNDLGFLKREWTTYEIPFLYIYENNNFYLKYHIFPPVESGDTEKAANIIHHHNNYILSSFTMFGPGYHTFHFDKNIEELPDGRAKLSATKDFFHAKDQVNIVESWEPHIVFNMDDTTTTVVLWSPDKKQATDGLRNHPLVKPFKGLLLSVIHFFGLNKKVGVAPKDVKQYYVQDGETRWITEADYFGVYKEKKGDDVSLDYVQAICHFMQSLGYKNDEFVRGMMKRKDLPLAYKKWLPFLISGEKIPVLYGKEEINIPNKEIRIEDLRKACA
ncbi:MAG TPA: hypothetical protein DCX14_08825 [Flavobacteriales bacterium]|nr:hypothetical protein [Flavobacteriales bacterium]HAW20271.1 hypothetical protein [Flavobacteriales bacterium]